MLLFSPFLFTAILIMSKPTATRFPCAAVRRIGGNVRAVNVVIAISPTAETRAGGVAPSER